ncbi:MAG: type II toxin-antitoxin system RatA family toxin [Gammaproteobacteria bacterium]|nr:type II toxin-antitoxin system RatA family toxin [Gammaproteobacteria bacterium]
MPRVNRSALLPYPAAKLFELVNDVARYPEFLPWCSKAEVVSASPEEMVAALTIQKGGLSERFTTRNFLSFPDTIELELVDGPFARMQGLWRFTALGHGCKVELDIEFEYSRGIMQRVIGGVFSHATSSLVDAFCVRARALYR